jgi:hypothetical protein
VKVYQEHANYGVYQDVVFLHDNQKFEIELHNPYTFKALAKIKFNGNYISESGIVINPGQRIFLERFIDKDESFVFSTYEIDNTEENRKATVNNGNVDVEFYSEMVITTSNTTYYSPNTVTTIYPSKPSMQPPYWYTATGSLTTGVSTYVSNTSNTNFNMPVAGSTETGRVERGESSGQRLYESKDNFNIYPFERTGVKILPVSSKPIEAKEIRSYCTECGTRVKKASWKFCPSCGTKI